MIFTPPRSRSPLQDGCYFPARAVPGLGMTGTARAPPQSRCCSGVGGALQLLAVSRVMPWAFEGRGKCQLCSAGRGRTRSIRRLPAQRSPPRHPVILPVSRTGAERVSHRPPAQARGGLSGAGGAVPLCRGPGGSSIPVCFPRASSAPGTCPGSAARPSTRVKPTWPESTNPPPNKGSGCSRALDG